MAADLDHMTDAELEALTAPDAGEAPPDVVEKRRAQGLPVAFDDDDDDLDEDLKPADEAAKKAEGEKAEDDTDEGEPGAEDPPPSAIPEELAERARMYEIDPAEFTDPKVLETAVGAVEKLFAKEGEARLAALEDANKKPEERPRNDDGTFKKTEPKDDESDAEFAEFIKQYGEVEPGLAKVLDKQHSTIKELRDANKKLAAIAEEIATEHKAEKERRQAAAIAAEEQAIEEHFASLAKANPVWAELFGTAKATELVKTAEGKKLLANRNAVLRAGDAYDAGLESKKLPTPGLKKLLEAGLRIAYGDKLAEAIRREQAAKDAERVKRGAPRPTRRTSGGAAARSALDEALARNKMPVE